MSLHWGNYISGSDSCARCFMGNKGKYLPSFATLYFYYTQPSQVSLIFVKITEP